MTSTSSAAVYLPGDSEQRGVTLAATQNLLALFVDLHAFTAELLEQYSDLALIECLVRAGH